MRISGTIIVALVPFLALAQSTGSTPAMREGRSTVHARFDLNSVSGAPFPSDIHTIPDADQRTGRRVNVPKPADCSTRQSDCDDLDVINLLDGFNIMPRISIPFDGAIDPASVSSSSVFLVELAQQGDETTIVDRSDINQAVWDPESQTLYVESDDVLRQTTRYAVVVTRGIRDASGSPVVASDDYDSFRRNLNYGQTGDENKKAYRKALIAAQDALEEWGVSRDDVVALSVFTTQSATATLENIRDYLKSLPPPAPANFAIGPGGSRAVFSVPSIKPCPVPTPVPPPPPGTCGITHWLHNGFTKSVLPAPTVVSAGVPLPSLSFVPGAVDKVGWATFASPQFIDASAVMGRHGTLGRPPVVGDAELEFVVFLPSGTRPAAGWPVVFLGHGGTTSIHTDAVWNFASRLAAAGFASIAINAVGRGWGPLSTLSVALTDGTTVQFKAPGRCIDQNNDGTIVNAEGAIAQPPNVIVGQRDAVRQTAIDYMQLVRVIEAGVDVDGDGIADLDPSRMAFLGNSFAVGYELLFMAIEPDVPIAAVGSPGGLPGRADLLSMRPSGRSAVGAELDAHRPSLLNAAVGLHSYGGLPVSAPYYNENIPLRDLAPVTNAIPGAMAIQEYFEHIEWAQNSEDAAAYAPHLMSEPLPGVPAKSMMILFAKGDQTAPNPRTSYIVRAGHLHDRTIFYRNDLAFADDPARVLKDPHTFLQRWASAGITGAIARGGQNAVALFLASGGATITQPEPAKYYEFPIQALPEDFSYIPP